MQQTCVCVGVAGQHLPFLLSAVRGPARMADGFLAPLVKDLARALENELGCLGP